METSISNLDKKDSSQLSSPAIDWHSFQTLYGKITGKKEVLRENYSDLYQIKIDDIDDLNNKISSILSSYGEHTVNTNVTINYSDNSDAKFSSFERFKLQYNSGNTAVKSVNIIYNYAHPTPCGTDFNHYCIKVNLGSKISIFPEIRKEFPKFIWKNIGYNTASAHVEYIDYTIAQNIIGIINKWFSQRTIYKSGKFIKLAQEHSSKISRASKYIFMILSGFAVAGVAPNYLESNNNSLLAIYLIYALVAITIAAEIGRIAGRNIESSIDGVLQVSYIELNDGDRKLIQETIDSNKNCWVIVVIKLLIFISFSLATNIVITKVTDLILS